MRNLTAGEYRVLAGLSGETPIRAAKPNVTFPYKVQHPASSVKPKLSTLYVLCGAGFLRSKFMEKGLAPPINFTITDEGIEAVQKYEAAHPPKRKRGA